LETFQNTACIARGNTYKVVYDFKGCGDIEMGPLILDATNQAIIFVEFQDDENPDLVYIFRDKDPSAMHYGGIAFGKHAYINVPKHPYGDSDRYTAYVSVKPIKGEYHMIILEYTRIPEVKIEQLAKSQ
jgi:hypothetical protein